MSNKQELAISARLRRRIKPETKRNVARCVAVGQQVRALLVELDWSQQVFAEKMGKQPSEISRWLSGLHNLTLESVAKMEEVLGAELLVTPEQAKAKYSSVVYLTVYTGMSKQDEELKSESWTPMKVETVDEYDTAA